MIPKSNLYTSSNVAPAHSRAEIEILLEKFGVKKFAWKRDDDRTAFLMFQRKEDFTGHNREVTYKVTIPFIEKLTGGKHSKVTEYDEIRSYRILFHILKALLLNTDVGMAFEQVFGNYIVVGQLENGDPMNVQDKIGAALVDDKIPVLELK